MADKNIFYSLKLSEYKLEIREDKQKGILKWGKKNDHPKYLLSLYHGDSVHGSIVNKKARYLTGNKIIASVQNPNIESLLNKLNPKESAHQVKRKTDLDQVIYGGFAVKILPNPLGQPITAYQLDMGKIRPCPDGKTVQYSEDWTDKDLIPTTYPIWEEGIKVASVYLYRAYNPTTNRLEAMFPRPEYSQCIVDIDSQKRLSVFYNSLIQNGFSAGTIVTIKEQPKDQNEKDYIVDSLTGDHAGEENAGKTVVIFTTRDGQGADVTRLNADDLDKQYQEVRQTNRENIIAGHGLPPVLAGLQTEGKLGQRNEIDLAHELFMNDYVVTQQQPFNEFLSVFCKAKTGLDCKFEVEQIQPIGIDWKDPAIQKVMTQNEIREKLGLSPLAEGSTMPGEAPTQQVNPNMKGLKGRENQDLRRITREFDKGILSEKQALLRLTSGFGFTEKDARIYLGIDDLEVQQSAQKNREDFFFTLFDKYAHEVQEDEVIDVLMKSEAFVEGTITEKRNAVLQLIKGNPAITSEEIARALNIEASEVGEVFAWLTEKKLIEGSVGNLTPTKKAFNKDTEVETEIYTEFRYDLRDDLKARGEPVLKNTTRDLCRRLYKMTRNKALSMSAIERMTNEFGESVWDFRGGFYGSEPWCRHIWRGETKIRRKKK